MKNLWWPVAAVVFSVQFSVFGFDRFFVGWPSPMAPG
jgi:hypothetical protein